ncbi:MAG: hypothetical protein HC819_22905 [Cyclobacteriaceae bacterium]|nr:hypothetical protein [Cyclobacteriaceae bacterium]
MEFLPATFLKKALSICLVVFSYQIHAQDDLEDLYIPASPSPKLAELSKYADFETIGQNGVVPIDIPLFSISAGQYTHPISLSYHSGGIKVNQDATWVGLGWSITMGGSITRSVRDVPDDVQNGYEIIFEGTGYHNRTHITEYGWLNDPNRIQNFPEITNEDYKTASDQVYGVSDEIDAAIALRTLKGDRPAFIDRVYTEYHPAYNQPKRIYDTEPDIYYLNIGNKSVKFIFGSDGIPKLLNSAEYYDIEPVLGGEHNITLEEFIVTDMLGVKYFFGTGGKLETTTVNTNYYSTNARDIGSDPYMLSNEFEKVQAPVEKTFTTGWFLTKVELLTGAEMIFEYFAPANPLLLDMEVGQLRTKQIDQNLPLVSYNANHWNKAKTISHSILTQYLKRITFPSGKVEMQLSPRSDISGAYKLSSIVLKNKSGNLINNLHFAYSYRDNRMFLDWMMNNDKRTSFEYNDTALPPKNSAQQDYWGYACAHSNDLIPQVYVYPNDTEKAPNYYRFHPLPEGTFALPEIILPGSDRRVDSSSIRAGVLEILHHATGGTTTYTYEPNEFYDAASGENIHGGGLRIANIVKKESDGTPLLQREYHYNNENNESSGVLINQIAFATPTTYSFDLDIDIRYNFDGISLSEFEQWDHFTLRSSNTYFPLTNLEGNQVGYSRVEIVDVGNGSIVSHYHRPQNFTDHSTPVVTAPMIGFYAFDNIHYKPLFHFEEFTTKHFLSHTCDGVEADVHPIFNIYSRAKGMYSSSGFSDFNNPFINQEMSHLISEGTIYERCWRDSGYKYTDDFGQSIYALKKNNIDYDTKYDVRYNDIYYGKVKQVGNTIFPYLPLSDDGQLVWPPINRTI